LNSEKKQAIKRICEDYQDTFHLEGEVLTSTATMESDHEKNICADTAPVNVKPYRLSEKHKTEVNRQAQEMLRDKIIRTSVNQWNAPLLVVPKKTDASGKPKLRVVVPEAE